MAPSPKDDGAAAARGAVAGGGRQAAVAGGGANANKAEAVLVWDTSADKSRKAGVRWRSVEGEIDRLNAIVRAKTSEFVAESAKTGKALSPEVRSVLEHPNDDVYKDRWVFMPVFFTTVSICLVLFGSSVNAGLQNPVTILTCFVFEFFWYDIFSGILHITLDNPEFIGFPILHEPCLEFQWHHHIPMDLTVKSFLQTCGDLNLVVGGLFAVYTGVGLYSKMNPTYCCLVGWKLIMAYFGQLCHCMSHMPAPYKPQWVVTLQNWGVMVSTQEHNRHHKNYDDNFCIGSGICNPLISYLRSVTANKWVWLGLFVFFLIADVPLANHLATTHLGFK